MLSIAQHLQGQKPCRSAWYILARKIGRQIEEQMGGHQNIPRRSPCKQTLTYKSNTRLYSVVGFPGNTKCVCVTQKEIFIFRVTEKCLL